MQSIKGGAGEQASQPSKETAVLQVSTLGSVPSGLLPLSTQRSLNDAGGECSVPGCLKDHAQVHPESTDPSGHKGKGLRRMESFKERWC